MQELIICKGLPASGKSTFSRQWVLEDPKTRIRVNRDDIRRMLGPYWVPTREDLVTEYEQDMVRSALRSGFSVIIDATNFKDQWIIDIHKRASCHSPNIELKVQDFTHIPLEECIKRDSLRSRHEQVGEKVILGMYNKYLKK